MAEPSDGAVGPLCEVLEWDSEHFGFPIARVRAHALTEDRAQGVDDWCHDHHIRCLYLCAHSSDLETAAVAAAHGFREVDTRVVCRRPYEGIFELPTGPEAVSVREAVGGDLDFARDLAAHSHHTSRFYFDDNFPRERCDALYRVWIERGAQDPDRRLLIGVVGGQPIGYMVTAPITPDGEGHGELGAIAEGYRGKGFGRALHFGEYRDYVSRGAVRHRGVISCRNLANIRLHERLGFLTDEIQVWNHKWFGP